MNFEQAVKAMVYGFLFGFILIWVFGLTMSLIYGLDFFMVAIELEMFSWSIKGGLFCGCLNLIFMPFEIRRKKREELQEEMMEYFRKQNEEKQNEENN